MENSTPLPPKLAFLDCGTYDLLILALQNGVEFSCAVASINECPLFLKADVMADIPFRSRRAIFNQSTPQQTARANPVACRYFRPARRKPSR